MDLDPVIQLFRFSLLWSVHGDYKIIVCLAYEEYAVLTVPYVGIHFYFCDLLMWIIIYRLSSRNFCKDNVIKAITGSSHHTSWISQDRIADATNNPIISEPYHVYSLFSSQQSIHCWSLTIQMATQGPRSFCLFHLFPSLSS